MNKEIEELLSIISEGQNSIQLQEIKNYITNLQEENQKLNNDINKAIEEIDALTEGKIINHTTYALLRIRSKLVGDDFKEMIKRGGINENI